MPAWRRPLAAVAAVLAAPIVLGFGLKALGFSGSSRPALALLAEGAFALVALGATWYLGWWRQTGLTAPWRQRPLVLLALAPAALIWLAVTPLLFTGYGRWGLLPVLVPLVALVGLAEELTCRGLVLYALWRRGPLVAGVGSAAIFGLLHFLNLTVRPIGPVSLQVVAAFQVGILFAAVRWRMGTIWPLVASHALVDLGVLLLTPMPQPHASWAFTVAGSLVVYAPFGLTGLGLLIYDHLEGRVPWRPRPQAVTG